MKHLKYILILALSSAMGTLQAQDLKELMKENRENREANYAKWGPTSDHDGMGYVVRAGFVLGGTTPLPLPKEIRKINEFAPKGGFSLGIDGYKYFNTRWGLSAGLRFFMQGMRTGAEVKNYNMAIVMGEDVVEGRFTGTDITDNPASYDFSGNMRRFSYGMEFCADLRVKKHLNVFALLDWGMTDVFKDDFETVTFPLFPIYATFGLAYYY